MIHKKHRKGLTPLRGRPLSKAGKGEVNRGEQLAATALDLFAERNFASVTIKDIAKEIGVNTALIYYYYKSKEDLFRAAIEFAIHQAFKNFSNLQARHENPVDVINNWLDNHVQLYAPIYKFVKVSLDYSGSQTKIPIIDQQIRQFYDEEKRILSKCIGRGIQQGQFVACDPDALALFISTYLDGVMVRVVILNDFDLNRAVWVLRQQIWAKLFGGDQAGEKSGLMTANI